MIPSTNYLLTTDLEVEEQPSKTYKMHMDKKNMKGYCDGLEAVRQAVYKILNTERYLYIMYSWDYGIQLLDLFGEPVTYVCPELERRITEALTWDDRIESCDGFTFDTGMKNKIYVKFTVHTILGDVPAEKVVSI